METLPAQLLARSCGLKRRIELPASFVRRVSFKKLVPSPSSTLVVLGFSRDGESILGVTSEGAAAVRSWPMDLALSLIHI